MILSFYTVMENRLARTYIPEFGCTLRQGILQVRIYLKTVQVRIVLVKNHPKLHISKQKKVILQTQISRYPKNTFNPFLMLIRYFVQIFICFLLVHFWETMFFISSVSNVFSSLWKYIWVSKLKYNAFLKNGAVVLQCWG